MAALKCDICGGGVIGRAGGVFACESCGTKYDVDWARQKIQEGSAAQPALVVSTLAPQPAAQPAPVVSAPAPTQAESRAKPLLDRGTMALRTGNWDQADYFFGEVLDLEPQNARAYMGKALVQENCRNLEELIQKRKNISFDKNGEKKTLSADTAYIEQIVEKYQIPKFVKPQQIRELYRFDLSYNSLVECRKQRYEAELYFWRTYQYMTCVEQYADERTQEKLTEKKRELFTYFREQMENAEKDEAAAVESLRQSYAVHLAKADEQASEIYEEGFARRDKRYLELAEQVEKTASTQELEELGKKFQLLADYRDSEALAQRCKQRIEEIQARLKREKEEARLREELRKKKKRRRRAIFLVLLSGVLFALLPMYHYASAEAKIEEGNLYQAVVSFRYAGAYRDARERSREVWSQITNQDTIAIGGNYILAVTDSGNMMLGGPNAENVGEASGWKDIIAVSASPYAGHVVGLKKDGTVVATGWNSQQQCAVGGWSDIVAIAVGEKFTAGLRSNGTVVLTGNYPESFSAVNGWEGIVAISATANRLVGLRFDGIVMSVGNTSSQYDVSGWRDIVSIDTGTDHIVGVKADGTVVAAGNTQNGRCDVSGWTDIISVAAGNTFTVGVKADGTVVSVGLDYATSHTLSRWSGIVQIVAEGSCVMGLKEDGTVVLVGTDWNVDWTDIKQPAFTPEIQDRMAEGRRQRQIRLESSYQEAERLLTEGKKAEAAIAFGQLGDYRDARSRSMKIWDEIADRDTITAGTSFTIGIETDGTLIMAGVLDRSGITTAVNNWKNIISITTDGHNYILGLKADGTVCITRSGNDGINLVKNWTDIVAIAGGICHCVGLCSDGTVSIVTYDYIDDFGSYTNVSGWTNIVAVAATWYRTIGLRADGTVVMAQGKTPVIDDRATALKPEDVKDWKNVIAIAAGKDHLVALKSDGTVVAAGDNEYGQCNVSYWRNIVAIEARGNTTIGLRADGTVVVAGIFYGGNSYSWRNIKEVTAGYYHVAGVKADGTVVATGYSNDSGELNVGNWKEIKVP